MLLDRTDPLLMRLKALEENCGQLCDLEKPVHGAKGEFMGRVRAKVKAPFRIGLLLGQQSRDTFGNPFYTLEPFVPLPIPVFGNFLRQNFPSRHCLPLAYVKIQT